MQFFIYNLKHLVKFMFSSKFTLNMIFHLYLTQINSVSFYNKIRSNFSTTGRKVGEPVKKMLHPENLKI